MEITKQYSKRAREMAPNDRLSGLPDNVLVHILSFLSMRELTTNILGRRWRFLWARAPDLYFDRGDHLTGASFLNFINRAMLLHKGHSINTLYLSPPDNCSNNDFGQWVATAVASNARKLSIRLASQVTLPKCVLPKCLFTCETLVERLLVCCGDIPMASGAVYLPALKKLRLELVRYESDESLSNLLSGCPVLEDLMFQTTNKDVYCCISSPTLDRLTLFSGFSNFGDGFFRVKLDTPALRYLCLHDSVYENFSAGALTSLAKANIRFYRRGPTKGEAIYFRSVIEFVGKLYNVKCLKLSACQMEVPDSAFSALTVKFHNLTKLQLSADMRFISKFLENADSIEVLTIRMVNHNLKYWIEPHQIPTCLLSHLKTVTIHEFECAEDEFELIKYLLRNGKVLKWMEICSNYDIGLKRQFDALKRISKFQRGSACELKFH